MRAKNASKTEIAEYLGLEAELAKFSGDQKCSLRLGEHFWSPKFLITRPLERDIQRFQSF